MAAGIDSRFLGQNVHDHVESGHQKPLQWISLENIGYFAAQAFINPSSYNTRGISLAGDCVSWEDANKVFKARTGQGIPTTFHFLAYFMIWLWSDVRKMMHWLSTEAYGTDIARLRTEHPLLLDFEGWLTTKSNFAIRSPHSD